MYAGAGRLREQPGAPEDGPSGGALLQHPALAIEQSRQVTDAMAQCAMENLLAAMALVHQYSDKGFRAVAETESTVDRYEDRLGTYLNEDHR